MCEEPTSLGDGDGAVISPAVETLPRHWAEETLRLLLESLPDAVLLINREGAIVLVRVEFVYS